MSSKNWYFTKEELRRNHTPEELKEENIPRRGTCAFLQDAGIKLRLPQLTIATAIVFFHRFYVYHTFQEYDSNIVGTTCLFLAGKVEETPKKLKDVIDVTHFIRTNKELKSEQEFAIIRDQILTHELIVLQTIAFDLTVEHPYKHLLTYVKLIQGNKNLAQTAWNFVNDSLRTTLCLQFRPPLIASAAIYLASKFLKLKLPEGKGATPWWEIFEARIEDLEEISNQILDLYEASNQDITKVVQSPSQLAASPATQPSQNTNQSSPDKQQSSASNQSATQTNSSSNTSTGTQVSQNDERPPPPPPSTAPSSSSYNSNPHSTSSSHHQHHPHSQHSTSRSSNLSRDQRDREYPSNRDSGSSRDYSSREHDYERTDHRGGTRDGRGGPYRNERRHDDRKYNPY